MINKNNNFSIRKYTFGTVSVALSVFFALALNGTSAYAVEDNPPAAVVEGTLPTTETTTPDVSVAGVDVTTNTNGDDSAVLPAVPTPVLPGFYADQKEAPAVVADPENLEINQEVYYSRLGKIKYVDKTTGKTIIEKVYENDKTDATKAADTILPDLPSGYEFISKVLTLQNATVEKVTNTKGDKANKIETQDVTTPLTESNGKLIFSPINDIVSAIKDGVPYSYSQGNNIVFYLTALTPTPVPTPEPTPEPKPEPNPEPKPIPRHIVSKNALPNTGLTDSSTLAAGLGALTLAGIAARRKQK